MTVSAFSDDTKSHFSDFGIIYVLKYGIRGFDQEFIPNPFDKAIFIYNLDKEKCKNLLSSRFFKKIKIS